MQFKRLMMIAAIGVCAGFAGVVVQRAATLDFPGDHTSVPTQASAAPVGGDSLIDPSAAPEERPVAPVAPVMHKSPKTARVQSPKAVAQHILVSFRDSELGLTQRSKEEARELAEDIARRLERGEDPSFLVEKFSDDPSHAIDRGIRRVSNWGHNPDPDAAETPRDALPAAYGDLLFNLERGKCGVAEYDKDRNGLGYFVVKRIE